MLNKDDTSVEIQAVNIARKNWTIELIRQFVINTFNVTFSHRGMADVLYRLKLSYTRPTYVLANADSEKQEIFKKDFEILKNTLKAYLTIFCLKMNQ